MVDILRLQDGTYVSECVVICGVYRHACRQHNSLKGLVRSDCQATCNELERILAWNKVAMCASQLAVSAKLIVR
jgi:hypothetical protein